ncbi:hypothetical protein BCR35DRAFT_331981 [Leucosporidium creatinivorum]|uniref:Uncharacterized protein n=1 Tax=Leucosporidium creatinivorum TaxID=106004 RepID=A0A1Y2F763_9BASI|nr:hypothetical protein BCR35DRAFT_331981 [Leucosporidium creatinivorum]
MLPLKSLGATGGGPLPLVRFILYALAAFLALGLLVLALATLITQLVKTVGYNKPVPAIFVSACLLLIHSFFYALPPPPAPSIRRILLGLRFELGSLCVLGLLLLASGLVAVSWILFLTLATLFTLLLTSSIYHHTRARRSGISSAGAMWKEPFAAFDWGVYSRYKARGMAGGGTWSGHRARCSVQLESGK